MEILTKNYLTRGFWGDEAWTALISQLPLKEIVATTSQDFHPPFYYFLVHFWIKIFGSSEVAIRSLSVLFWLLTGLVVYRFCLLFWQRRQAVLATVFVLANPFVLTYACEARSYALLTLLTATSMFSFWRTREKWQPWGWLYLLVNVAGVYTHYYMWFIILAQGLYLLIFQRESLKKFIPLFFGLAIFYLPWLPVLLKQSGEVVRDYWIPKMNDRTHWETFFRLVAGHEEGPVAKWLVRSYLFLFGAYLFLWLKRSVKKIKPEVGLLFLWLLIPVLVPTLVSFWKPIYFYRYLVFLSVPLALLAFSHLSGRKTWAVGLVLIFLNLILDYRIFGRQPLTMREALAPAYSEPYRSQVVYTFLPSFAEVAYYNQGRFELIVSSEGLVQFSGKSLLDALVKKDQVRISSPPAGDYWQAQPGPKVTFKRPLKII